MNGSNNNNTTSNSASNSAAGGSAHPSGGHFANPSPNSYRAPTSREEDDAEEVTRRQTAAWFASRGSGGHGGAKGSNQGTGADTGGRWNDSQGSATNARSGNSGA